MNSNVYLRLMITFIIFQETTAATERLINNPSPPTSPIMCYDENRKPIRGDPQVNGYDPNCVYTAQAIKTLMVLTSDALSTKQVNPECKHTEICIAACKKSKCLSMGAVSGVFSHKTLWTIRFVIFSSIFTGFALAFLVTLHCTYRYRLLSLKSRELLAEQNDDSESRIESEREEDSAEDFESSDSFKDSLCSGSEEHSRNSYSSEKIVIPQKRKLVG